VFKKGEAIKEYLCPRNTRKKAIEYDFSTENTFRDFSQISWVVDKA